MNIYPNQTLLFIIICMAFNLSSQIHNDVICETYTDPIWGDQYEHTCQIKENKRWYVNQCNYGCWCAATIMLLQMKKGFEDNELFENEIEEITQKYGINCCDESVGLFCYCEDMCPTGMQYLLLNIGGIGTSTWVHLEPYGVISCIYPDEVRQFHKIYFGFMNSEIEMLIKSKKAFAISIRQGINSSIGHILVVYGYEYSNIDEQIGFTLLCYDSGRKFGFYEETPKLNKLDLEEGEGNTAPWIWSNSLIPDDPLPVSCVEIDNGKKAYIKCK